jgi:hypothetical protein
MVTTPLLAPGHTLTGKVSTPGKLDYWLALDDKGYEYVVGAWFGVVDGVPNYTEAGDDGKIRHWRGGQDGSPMSRIDAEASADAYRATLPRQIRSTPLWTLPSGIPAKDSPQLDQLKALANGIIRREVQRGAWLTGLTGSGKTQGLRWIGLACSEAGANVCHLPVTELARVMRASYGGSSPEDKAKWFRLQAHAESCDVLCLDDVGSEGAGDDLRAELLRIVDLRQDARSIIVASSNIRKANLTAPPPKGCGMDERLASRFGMLREVVMEAVDYRKAR